MHHREQGFLIGPDESSAEFEERIKQPATSLFPQRLKDLFGISPGWVKVTYKDRGLRFWEGGCSWVDSPYVEIQLRNAFKRRQHLWGLYSKEEILAHEGVHAARVAFEEPIFEEVLAYQTSSSPFRRYFGPIIRSPKESLLVAIFASLVPLSAFFFPLYPFAVKGVIVIGLFGLLRLMRTQRQFRQAKEKLAKIYADHVLKVMLHLTDKEIIQFSKSSLRNIEAYIADQKCPRWEQIKCECAFELCSQSPALDGI